MSLQTKTLLLISFILIAFSRCSTAPAVQSPEFSYQRLVMTYHEQNTEGHLPLTFQRGGSMEPRTAVGGRFLFYSARKDGSRDIRVRDLHNTNTISLISHPSEQYTPAPTPDGKYLVFVSEDRDSEGDLRIVKIGDLEGLIQNAESGGLPPSLWEDSENLSRKFKEILRNENSRCNGDASEHEPVWSNDGHFLFFTSNRCDASAENLWVVEMEDEEPVSVPRQLTVGGAYSPAPDEHGDHVVYITRSGARGDFGDVMVLDVKTGETRNITDQLDPGSGLILRVTQNPSGESIYYTLIKRDDNGNGRLDPNDNASLMKVKTAKSVQGNFVHEQLLESSAPIYDIRTTDLIEGAVAYAARIHKNINIFLLGAEGVVSRKPTIDEQYEAAGLYRKSASHRYILSLDAVKRYYGDTRQYLVYEGDIFYDKVLAAQKNKTIEMPTNEEKDSMVRKNPYAELVIRLRAEPALYKKIQYVEKFIQDDALHNNNFLSRDSGEMLLAAARERLTDLLIRAKKNKSALIVIRKLLSERPDYFRKFYVQSVEAILETILNDRISPVYKTVLSDPGITYERREKLNGDIIGYILNGRSSDDVLKFAEEELSQPGVHPLIRAALLYGKARALYNKGQSENSLEIALKSADEARIASGNLVPESSGIRIRALQLSATIQSSLNLYKEAYNTRLQYGGSYRPETGVRISINEFSEIIEEAEEDMRHYLQAARYVAGTVEETGRKDFLSDILQGSAHIKLSTYEKDVLFDFCAEKSSARELIPRLGKKKYVDQYSGICVRNRNYFSGSDDTGLSMDDAVGVVDLLYLTGYVNVNILNIMFLHMKKVGLFPDIHKMRSVYYHKQKIDIAAERNRTSLRLQQLKKGIVDPGEIVDLLTDSDPFDTEIFQELNHGYEVAFEDARTYGDFSLLYGDAYTYVKKAVEREMFVDGLSEKGIYLERDQLREQKEKALQDLKNAGYRLMYILYRDSKFVNAYLLLGWVYEYIDGRRNHVQLTSPGFITGLIDSRPDAIKDRELHKKIYPRYFPERLFEENVELYQQALEIVSDDSGLKEKAHLHLNLADNYFELMNYHRAAEEYGYVEDVLKAGTALFDNYTERATYYINYGRSLFYEGQFQEASKKFRIAYNLYYQKEYSALRERRDTLRFYSRYKKLKEQKEDEVFEQKLADARVKLAVISSLEGLSHWYGGSHDVAVVAYRNAYSMLYESGTIPKNAIPRSALYNHLALAYQGMGRYENSDEYAVLAGASAKEEGLKRDDSHFKARTLTGKILGSLMGYNEDFFIIGQGKNPYGFSSLRQFELSLGVRMQNALLQGNRGETLRLNELRKKFFEEYDGDVNLGRQGVINSYNIQAYSHYEIGDYKRSAVSYLSAAEKAKEYELLDAYRFNIRNYFLALFANLEIDDVNQHKHLIFVNEGLERMNEFRETYREKKINAYTWQKKIEKPDFSYEETKDGAAVDALVENDLSEIIEIEGILLYYKGLILDRFAGNAKDIVDSKEIFQESVNKFTIILNNLEETNPKPYRRIIRLRLNRAKAIAGLGNLYYAEKELKRIAELAYEFNLNTEAFYIYHDLVRISDNIASSYGDRSRSDAIPHFLKKAYDIIEEHPETHFSTMRAMKFFYEEYAWRLIGENQHEKAIFMLDRPHELQLHENYTAYPHNFKNRELDLRFDEYRKLLKQLKSVTGEESESLILRKPFAEISKISDQIVSVRQDMRIKRGQVLKAAPGLAPFFKIETGDRALHRKKNDMPLLRLWKFKNAVHAWFIPGGENRIVYYRKNLPETALDQSGEESLKKALDRVFEEFGIQENKHIYVLPGNEVFPVLVKYQREELRKRGVYISFTSTTDAPEYPFVNKVKLLDNLVGGGRFINAVSHRIGRTHDDYDDPVDAMEFLLLGRESLRGRPDDSYFYGGRWTEDMRHPSMTIFQYDSIPSFRVAASAYDYSRAGGARASVFFQKNNLNQQREKLLGVRGKSIYPGEEGVYFGFPGFKADSIKDEIHRLYKDADNQTQNYLKRGDYKQAVQTSRLAASYISFIDAEKEERTNVLFREASLMILTGQADEGSKKLTDYMDSLSETDYENLWKGASLLISTNYRAGNADRARKYFDIYRERVGKYENKLLAEVNSHEFRIRLHRPDYTEDGIRAELFPDEFQTNLNLMVQSQQAESDLTAIIRHNQFPLSRMFMERMPDNAFHKNNKKIYESVIHVNSYLLKLDDSTNSYARQLSSTGETTAERLLYFAEAGKSDSFETELKNPEMMQEKDISIVNFRKTLYKTYYLLKNGIRSDTQALEEAVNTPGRSLIGEISLSESALLFRILVLAIPYDSELKVALQLDRLIQYERNEISRDRATIMALLASRAYLLNNDPETAEHFFLKGEELSQGMLPDSEVMRLMGEVGMSLQVARFIESDKTDNYKDFITQDHKSGEYIELSKLYLMAAQKDADIHKIYMVMNHSGYLRSNLPDDEVGVNFRMIMNVLRYRYIREKKFDKAIEISEVMDRFIALKITKQKYLESSHSEIRLAQEIQKRLNRNEKFVTILEHGDKAYRITLYHDRSRVETLPHSGRYMRGRLNTALIGLEENENPDIYKEVTDIYSRLYNGSTFTGESTIYIHGGGIHKLAPVLPGRGKKLYTVANLTAFVSGETVRETVLKSSRSPTLIAEKSPSRLLLEKEKQFHYNELFMEELALKHAGKGKTDPSYLHFMMPIMYDSGYGFRGLDLFLKKAKQSKFWFLSGNLPEGNEKSNSWEMSSLMYLTGENVDSPGVFVLRRASGASHTRFVRKFYETGLKNAKTSVRYFLAYHEMLKHARYVHEMYGYRLLTPTPIR